MKKKWYYLIAFLIPLVICTIILIAGGVYPFGKRCILHVDMYHQYCPFFMEFSEKLKNGGSLFYTWNLGLGSDFLSLYAYYLASPLNWLLIICPKAFVIEFMTITILLKIAGCGLSFAVFLNGHYQLADSYGNIRKKFLYPAWACSVAYALCGFVCAYNWDIMWMDCIVLAPLIILGLEKLVKEGKVLGYYVFLALSILANFYISYMICLFLCFYFLLLFIQQKKGRWIAAVRFAFYSLLAGGTGAILILPEIKVLELSGSSGISFPKKNEWYFGFWEELSRMCVNTEVHTGNDHWPNIYTGVFTIFFLVLYILHNRISWKDKLPRLAMIALFLVSFAWNWPDFIWHGLHFPNSLPGRQSFLYSFLLLSMSFAVVRNWRGVRLWHAEVAAICSGTFLALAWTLTGTSRITFWGWVLTAAFLFCYATGAVLLKVAPKKARLVVVRILALTAIAEIGVNAGQTSFSTTSRTYYTQKMKDYENLLAYAADDSKGEFYRVEDPERYTKNDDMLYGYPSTTQFSSLMNINVSHFFQKLQMEGGKNFYCYNGATPLLTSMLSVKYLLLDNDKEGGYLASVEKKSGNYYLYKNNYCLPLGFMMTEQEVSDWKMDSSIDRNNINQLGKALGANEDLLVKADYSMTETKGSGTYTMKEEGYFYASYTSCKSDTLTAKVGDLRMRDYSKASHRYMLDLGFIKLGESVTISNKKEEKIGFTIYRLNRKVLEQAQERLSAQTMELTRMTDTKIEGTIDVKEEGRLIFSIAKEPGWTLYVDGKETEAEDFKEAFLSVHLPVGRHQIRLSYRTPQFIEGAFVTTVCVLLFSAAWLVRRKKRRDWR